MKDCTITYENLVLSTFETEHILSLEMVKETNRHTSLHVIAILSEENAEEYIYLTEPMTPVTLGYMESQGKLETLFRGRVVNLRVEKEGDLHYMDLYALGNTYALDILRCSRSFQDVGMTVHGLVGEVMKHYPGSKFKLEIPDEPIGKLVVQYQETDWQFLKRFLSRYGAVILPDVAAEGIAYYIGVPLEGDIYQADAFRYTMSKSMDEYMRVKENRWSDVSEIDFIHFTIEDKRVFGLGEHIELGSKSLFVEKAHHVLGDGILKNTYSLKRKKGFQCLESYNGGLIGASVTGRVVDVARDKVMVELEIDEAGMTGYWFPYSTMSASPDGSGWYCMPEKGDQIRVCFPTADEGEAYAVSSVSSHQPGPADKEDPMANPNVKYLQTKNDQVIKFAEEGIIINSGSGKATIFLGNSGEVSIYGENCINVTAKETLSLVSKNQLLLGAQESVTLKNENAEISLNKSGEIQITGTKIYSN